MSRQFYVDAAVICTDGKCVDMDDELFWNVVMDFIESQGWAFVGQLDLQHILGYITVPQSDTTAQCITGRFANWAHKHDWTFRGTVEPADK